MMKRMAFLAMIVLFGSGAASAQADQSPARPSVFSDYLNPQAAGSFLHVPGLSFSTSAGFSYFSGSGMESFGMGYYMGHFGLKLASSLSLNWDIGVGSIMKSTSEYNQPQFFVPNVDLTFRPSDNFMLRLEYHQYRFPGHYNMLGR